jgi:hypothetical protein
MIQSVFNKMTEDFIRAIPLNSLTTPREQMIQKFPL